MEHVGGSIFTVENMETFFTLVEERDRDLSRGPAETFKDYTLACGGDPVRTLGLLAPPPPPPERPDGARQADDKPLHQSYCFLPACHLSRWPWLGAAPVLLQRPAPEVQMRAR